MRELSRIFCGYRDDLLWLAVFGGLSSLACLLMAAEVGPTFDEPLYLTNGRQCWHEWSCAWLAVHGTMPLPVDVQTALPVIRESLGGPRADDLAALRLARAGNLVFWWALLAYALLLGRELGGPWAGRLAVGFFAADPTWQAHAGLATTDVAAAASVVALVYHTIAARRRGMLFRLLVPGVFYGLAILTKLSGLVYGGLALAVIDLWLRAGAGGGWRGHVGPFLGTLAGRAVIGVAIATASCGVDARPDRGRDLLVAMGDEVPLAVRAWADEHPTWVPNVLVAGSVQAAANRRPYGSYLFGSWRTRGVAYYYPAVMTMKMPDALLLAAVIVLIARPRSLANLPLALAVVLLLATLPTPRQIGVRLVFPPLALGSIGLAVALAQRRRGIWLGGAALIGSSVAAMAVWPNGLAYMNQLSGGSDRADREMSDSNVDWGQGVPELLRWHEAHGRPPTALWYFGTDPRASGPPFRPVDLKADGIQSGEDLRTILGPTLLAVGHSVTTLYPDDPPEKLIVGRWLAGRKPVGRTTTFLIYDLRAAD